MFTVIIFILLSWVNPFFIRCFLCLAQLKLFFIFNLKIHFLFDFASILFWTCFNCMGPGLPLPIYFYYLNGIIKCPPRFWWALVIKFSSILFCLFGMLCLYDEPIFCFLFKHFIYFKLLIVPDISIILKYLYYFCHWNDWQGLSFLEKGELKDCKLFNF